MGEGPARTLPLELIDWLVVNVPQAAVVLLAEWGDSPGAYLAAGAPFVDWSVIVDGARVGLDDPGPGVISSTQLLVEEQQAGERLAELMDAHGLTTDALKEDLGALTARSVPTADAVAIRWWWAVVTTVSRWRIQREEGHDGTETPRDILRWHRAAVEALAAEHGLSHLRATEGGLILARLELGRGYGDLGEFDEAVCARTGIAVRSHPEEVLERPGHSPELDEGEEL